MHAPLYIKFRTKTQRCYIYDLGTGEILEVDETVYAIIDDYRLLTHEEILVKYTALGHEAVKMALRDLDESRKDGYLADHPPKELAQVERIWFEKKLYELDDFWGKMASLLILGITERCNLCCEYCCYSGKFVGHRPHRNRSMPREIAEKAIIDYLGNEPASDGDFYPVTFYGGEPLLEFDLMRELVEFADDLAGKYGKWFRYAVTTNGTLLDDSVTDFLVEHNFMVIVSLDGPKSAHDRYRLFRDGNGSFETVMRNLRCFAERHPDYINRGVNMVMAPPLDLDEAARFMKDLYADYPLSRASIVNTGAEARFLDESPSPTRYGCFAACSNERFDPDRLDTFRNFTASDRQKMNVMWNACIESLAKCGIEKTKAEMPLPTMLFEQQIEVYHRRNISKKKPEYPLMMPCFPGFTRRFCDVEGNYRICERVDDSAAFIIGDVWNGPDVEKLHRTMEMRRHFGDCANCTAMKTCDICYARIPNSDDMATGFDPLYDEQCQRTRTAALEMIRVYTEIMEENPEAFDFSVTLPPSRSDSLRYGVKVRPLSPETKERLRCESMKSELDA